MKRNETILRELREELRYWQGMARMEARWLKASREKCQVIGTMMRALQPQPKKELRPADWRPSEFIAVGEQKELL